jgi:hypothetical protein
MTSFNYKKQAGDYIISDINIAPSVNYYIDLRFSDLALNLNDISEKLHIETLWKNPNLDKDKSFFECLEYLAFCFSHIEITENKEEIYKKLKLNPIIRISFLNNEFVKENFNELIVLNKIKKF